MGGRLVLVGRLAQPHQSLGVVPRQADASQIGRADRRLTVGVALVGGLAEPDHGLGRVERPAASLGVALAKAELRRRIATRGGGVIGIGWGCLADLGIVAGSRCRTIGDADIVFSQGAHGLASRFGLGRGELARDGTGRHIDGQEPIFDARAAVERETGDGLVDVAADQDEVTVGR